MQPIQSDKSLQEQNSFFPALRGDQRGVLIGKTGSGKSYVARHLLKMVREAGWRIVIIDPKKDWQGRNEDKRPYAKKKV